MTPYDAWKLATPDDERHEIGTADGQPCCNNNPETTSLCHIRAFGWAGTSEKPMDFLAVFACSDCHDALDRRRNGELWGWDDVTRALGETLIAQHRMGNLIVA